MSESWQGYRLVPEDVLFFRDGKPSSIGEDHYLRSIFLPYPSTIFGMVRTRRMQEQGCDLSQVSETWWDKLPSGVRDEVGEWGGYGSLKLHGPWLVRDTPDGEHEILLPAPLDLLVNSIPKDSADGAQKVTSVLRLLRVENHRRGKWSHDLGAMSPCAYKSGQWTEPDAGEKEPKPAQGWFLTMHGIESWMAGLAPSPEVFFDGRALWSVEMRSGVGLQSERRVSQDGMLYTFGLIRLARGVSIGFELSGGKLEIGHHVRLGGENRLAFLTEAASMSAQLKEPARASDGSVFSLLAPGIFDAGSTPPTRVSAAVVPDCVRVGGWDLARSGPKPLWRAAPAGSVYYIDDPQEQLSSLSKQSNEGFGLMLRGSRPRR